MDIIYFSYVPGEKEFQITIKNSNKQFNFVEKDLECLQSFMNRTTKNAEIFLSKKFKLNGLIVAPAEVCFFLYTKISLARSSVSELRIGKGHVRVFILFLALYHFGSLMF